MIIVIGPRDSRQIDCVNVTSRSTAAWSRELSPFFLGPVGIPYAPTRTMLDAVEAKSASVRSPEKLSAVDAIRSAMHGTVTAMNVENAWQYSKVYAAHDDAGEPTPAWYRWRAEGFASRRAIRYPMGKGVRPEYSWYDGQRLSYIEARRRVYIPIYSSLAKKTDAYKRLEGLAMAGRLVLWDFDGYDHRALGMSYEDVINCESRPLGHAFVLAMMLEGLV